MSDTFSLSVLYEDNHLIAVYKPPNVLSQADCTQDGSLLESVRDFLKQKYEKKGNVFLGLLHRLDRVVSGVVLFAKTSKGASRVSEQFRNHQIQKTYWAGVEGVPKVKSGFLSQFYEWDLHLNKAKLHDHAENGKRVQLHYQVLRVHHENGLVKVQPTTGRKHQIRAQMASLGTPILGDRRYGACTSWEVPGIALVAIRLELIHPIQRERKIVIELPKALNPLYRFFYEI